MPTTLVRPLSFRSVNFLSGVLSLLLGLDAASVHAANVRVTIQNLAPSGGVLLTPVWVGFHDGTFDLYNRGAPASAALERLAEDGMTGPLSGAFAASGAGGVDGTIFGSAGFPPFAPGGVASMDFSLDPFSPSHRYFSYASMLIPSNDAFVGNGNPLAFPIFDGSGSFLGADFIVLGTMVLDAGTEMNDELPANTAFFGQAAPDTGVNQNGLVELHSGFAPAGAGGVLDGAFGGFSFANADFLSSGYSIARITVTPIPEGSSVLTGAVLAVSLAGWAIRRRRQPGV